VRPWSQRFPASSCVLRYPVSPATQMEPVVTDTRQLQARTWFGGRTKRSTPTLLSSMANIPTGTGRYSLQVQVTPTNWRTQWDRHRKLASDSWLEITWFRSLQTLDVLFLSVLCQYLTTDYL
jgi:hypothetical protein